MVQQLVESRGATTTWGMGTASMISLISAHTGWLVRSVLFIVRKSQAKHNCWRQKRIWVRMKQEIPLSEEERAAVDDGLAALEKLCQQLTDVPTPAGPTPRDLGKVGKRMLPMVPTRM